MNWLLILVIAILAIFTIHGYHKGFIRKVFSLFSIMIAIFLVMEVMPYVSGFLEKTPVYDTIKDKYVENLKNNEEADLENESQLAELLEVPWIVARALLGEAGEEAEERIVGEVYDVIGSKMTDITIKIMSFVITFLLIMIIMNMIIFVLDLAAKLPVIKGFNKIAGLFAGALEGLIVIWVCMLLITLFGGGQTGKLFHELIREDVFLNFLYNNNYVLKLITGM